MLERVLSFLRDLPSGSSTTRKENEPRIAAAALMYHVMDADGLRQDVEWDRIKSLLAEEYAIAGDEVERLVSAGRQADNEAVDLYAFTSVLKRSLDEEGRVHFIRMLWDIVYADGELHELEDNTLWRVPELLGGDRRDRTRMRQEAARGAGEPSGGED